MIVLENDIEIVFREIEGIVFRHFAAVGFIDFGLVAFPDGIASWGAIVACDAVIDPKDRSGKGLPAFDFDDVFGGVDDDFSLLVLGIQIESVGFVFGRHAWGDDGWQGRADGGGQVFDADVWDIAFVFPVGSKPTYSLPKVPLS